MTAKRQPNEREYITNKVLTVFTVCLIGVLGMMLLYNILSIGSSFGTGMLIVKIVCALGALGTIGGIVKLVLERKQGLDTRFQLTRGLNIIILCAAIMLAMFAVWQIGYQTIKVFYVLLPALAVYYLIFHSYPREFFIVAVDCGVAAAFLWLARTAFGTTNFGYVAWVAAAAAVLLAVVQLVLVQRVRKAGCTGLVDGKRTQLFTSPHAYMMMHLTCVVMAAFVVVGAVIGAQMAYYLVFAAFAYLFVSAVYYTVKML